ncbi:P-loop containing nucleoside triphosphate hydrolase protein [Kalaharituber pfeilii]|nr:P-loop containing nucleoside triphosphate hydrolase protein [Kalaharituber pfeilii]
MVPPKKKSKRVPVRLRHKIERKVAAKARKERKMAKKHPELHRKKKPEKLNIPNSFPYKDRLLAQIEEERRRKEEERLKRIEEAKKKRKELAKAGEEGEGGVEEAMEEEDVEMSEEGSEEGSENEMEDDTIATGNPAMAALLASARARVAEYEAGHESDDAMEEDSDDDYSSLIRDNDDGETRLSGTRKDTSRKAFDKMFKTVLDAADVILYVLDARDPNGTRSRAIERQIMAAEGGEKRLILILNKIDLVPPHVLKGWLLYLRQYFPTLPLKATTAAPNAATFDHKALTMQGTSATLFKALKSYANSKQLKRSISVGVIGYPNVGKSSVINALTSRVGGTMSACPVGAEAGVTTSLREVKLDKKLKIIDCPGIVFPGSENGSISNKKNSADETARLILMNAVPPKQILDPVPAVTLLLKRLSTSKQLFEKLLAVYNIPPLLATSTKDLTNDFLVQVARKRGRLGKGGVPNINSAALCVINDWRDGRIQGWVDPPVMAPTANGGVQDQSQGIRNEDADKGAQDQKEIVTEWAKEFKLEGLWGDGEGNDGGGVAMEE